VKRTLFVVALATMLVFAVAGSAFAVNHSGQQRLGAPVAGGEDAVVPGSGTVAGAGTYTYEDWQPALYGNAQTDPGLADYAGNSPHGNYTTTTVKCVVCHAVHYAAAGGAPVGSSQTADTLLRVRADQACAYCHATAGAAVNGRPVYNGLGGAALTGALTGGAFDTGHYTGTNCNCCHSNVHGAGADHSVAALDGYLLLALDATNVQGTGADTANMLDAITAIDHNAENQGFAAGAALNGTIGDYASVNTDLYRQQAVGIFCAECHNGAYATAAAGAATNVRASGTTAYSGHRIAAAATADWNADGSKSSGAFNGTVAWAEAANCKSCHDSVDIYGNAAFPHAWGQDSVGTDTKMWLLSAADAGATKTALDTAGTYTATGFEDAPAQLTDGVCLKCHVASGGTEGVGISY